MSELAKRLERELRNNPEKADELFAILAKAGMLEGRTVKTKKISNATLSNMSENTKVIIK